jgi:YggT family protein
MIFFANFLNAVAKVLHIVLMLYIWIVIFRAVLSWVRVPALYTVSVILYYLTEPVLRPVRRFVPPQRMGGIDISPMIVILLILFVDSFLVKSLSLYAQQLMREQLLYY